MAIPNAVQSIIPQAIAKLYNRAQNISFYEAWSLSSGCERVFYATLRRDLYNTPIIKNICNTAVANINELQALFGLVNFGFFLEGSYRLVKEARNYSMFTRLLGVNNAIPTLVVAIVNYNVASYIVQRTSPSADMQARFFSNMTGKKLQIARSILNIGLVCLGKERLLLTSSLISSGYTIWKNHQIKWMQTSKIKRGFFSGIPFFTNSVKFTYYNLILGNERSLSGSCSICKKVSTKSEPFANTIFCSKGHGFHKNCLKKYFTSLSNTFSRNALYARWITKEYSYGGMRDREISYEVEVPRKNIPSCPVCQEIPSQNALGVTIDDADYGEIKTTATGESISVELYRIFKASIIFLVAAFAFPHGLIRVFEVLHGIED